MVADTLLLLQLLNHILYAAHPSYEKQPEKIEEEVFPSASGNGVQNVLHSIKTPPHKMTTGVNNFTAFLSTFFWQATSIRCILQDRNKKHIHYHRWMDTVQKGSVG